MFTRLIEAKATSRAAVAGLAVGLIALAGLSLWGSLSMEGTTARLHRLNEASDRWGQVGQFVDLADHAMSDYLRSRSSGLLRQPLASAATDPKPESLLQWLQRHGAPEDVDTAIQVGELYGDYTQILRRVVALGDQGDNTQLERQAEQAQLAVNSLRKQLSTIVQVKRLETTEYLDTADHENQQLRLAAIGAFVVDLGLVGLCGTVLLGYRRRVLREAAKNEYAALHDALTGLANRTLLAQRTERAIQQAEQHGNPVGLLLVDLNRFKEVNDTLGHLCGDRLLQEVAVRLAGAVRDGDTVARLGGDEFAVLLPWLASTMDASDVADRIARALGRPVEVDGLTLEVSGSIGVAVYPTHSADADELLKHADIAMYAAKRNLDWVTVYEPGLATHSTAEPPAHRAS